MSSTLEFLLPRSAIQKGDSDQQCTVTFDPPLSDQRCLWIVEVLVKEKVTRILDVGCGNGHLLSSLCSPAPWLLQPLAHFSHLQSNIPSVSTVPYEGRYFDPTELHGLDISSDLLESATRTTAPRPSTNRIRWNALKVKIWEGALESVNEEFIDMECIVSSEVLSNLSPISFSAFAPVLLGVYHPRLLVLTTPSYTFNERFVTPSAPISARRGHPDPTGMTTRVYRNGDHLFEWTDAEFLNWCQVTASLWGYTVEVSSIGRAIQVDQWERDEKLGGATLVAVFRRIKMNGSEGLARQKLKDLGPFMPHKSLAVHQHASHPMSGLPRPFPEIAKAVVKKMKHLGVEIMRAEDIWLEKKIAVWCGGSIGVLMMAVKQSHVLALKTVDDEMDNDDYIELIPSVLVDNPMVDLSAGKTGWSHYNQDYEPNTDRKYKTLMDLNRLRVQHLRNNNFSGTRDHFIKSWPASTPHFLLLRRI